MASTDSDVLSSESTAVEHDVFASDDHTTTEPENGPPAPPLPRPLRIYTRAQILALLKSPLVALPPNMPDLKDWFGMENEQNLSKKDHEATPPNSARDRRFRRDAEDGESSTRPLYRTALAQPTQMGNFKHQSLRERDGDKDRDLRDKEGQERLRNLSDKFDRDRLALPLSSVRNKDRDSTATVRPHANQLNGTATRRPEGRENGKKKLEAADDWRRGGETRRGDREERPRSRSRQRRDPSTRREDRDREHRRDRDADEDSRRWRDDGRRDERVAARRDREHKERWPAGDDRDARTKRPLVREKKSGEDAKDGADRRAEREKEKEPAWMDTYVPPPSASGILGGKSAQGELDGIQAWKKGMKEKEQRANDAEAAPKAQEKGLDEIQIFKMLMKREQDQKKDGDGDLVPSSGPKSAAPLIMKDHITGQSTVVTETASSSTNSAFNLPERPKPSEENGLSSALSQLNVGEPDTPSSTFNPPQGPRLLALGRVPAKVPPPISSPPSQASPNATIKRSLPQLNLSGGLDNMDRNAFSPFEEQRDSPLGMPSHERLAAIPPDGNWNDPMDSGTMKGSRFAKFFDGKGKEAPTPKMQPPVAIQPHASVQRPEQHNNYQQQPERSIDNIFTMLHTSSNVQRPPPPITAPPGNGNHLSHQQMHLLLQQQQQQSQLLQHMQPNHRVDSLFENRLDNRNFMPDNLVPGLRSAPPPRNRDNGGMFSDPLDEVIHLNAQRVPPPSIHRGVDPFSGNGMPPYAQQQLGRGGGIPVQHYRGGPSPIGNQNGLGLHSQRLPPGLANLGARPPHEPSQFTNIPGLNSAALHGGPINAQQTYNNYSNMGPGFNNGPPRGIPASQLPGNLQQHQLAGLGHQNLMDIRNHNVNQATMLNVGGPLSAGRGLGGGFPGHGQLSHHPMRQPAQQPHPQMVNHLGMMPSHMPPQVTDAQSANLMALLLGRPNRD